MNIDERTEVFNELFVSETVAKINRQVEKYTTSKANRIPDSKIEEGMELIAACLMNIHSGPMFDPILSMSETEKHRFYRDAMDKATSLLRSKKAVMPIPYRHFLEIFIRDFSQVDTIKPCYDEILRRAHISA